LLTKNVVIINYGMGNLLSVQRSLEKFNANVIITNKAEDIISADRIVLPGVGSFNLAMKALHKLDLIKPIMQSVKQNTPLLGICLGMQILFESGEEFGYTEGLGLISGSVRHLLNQTNNSNIKLPHIGWSAIQKPDEKSWDNTILKDNFINDYMYFVHSYMASPLDKSTIIASTDYYGIKVTGAIKLGNLYGCQFHPEKSGPCGLKIIKNFLEI
jgi:glutamine amidotransferase